MVRGVLLLPPALVLTVLLFLERIVSPVYAPNRFFMGILFGIPAGFLEEIGWTGKDAFPKMRPENNGSGPEHPTRAVRGPFGTYL